MLPRGPAKKVTIYLNEDTRQNQTLLWNSILGFLRHHHVSGATVFRAEAGFGSHGQYHDSHSEYLAEHRPMRIEFVDTAERVDRLLPNLYEMVTDGLITVQELTIVKSAAKNQSKKEASPPPRRRTVPSKSKLLRIFLGESDRFEGEPLYQAIVKRLQMEECAGATVQRGILGYGAKGHTRKGGRFHLSHDLPITISVVESAEKVAQLIGVVSAMLEDGVIVTSDVESHQIVFELPDAGSSHAPDVMGEETSQPDPKKA